MRSESQTTSFTGQNRSECGAGITPNLPRKGFAELGQVSGDVMTSLPQQVSVQGKSAADYLPPRLQRGTSWATASLRPRQSWTGTVTGTEGNIFRAVLVDETDRSKSDEEGEFSLEEVSPEEQGLVAPGAIFYWTVGTEKTIAGQVKNVSMLQFKRVPQWTRQSLRRAEVQAVDFAALFEEA